MKKARLGFIGAGWWATTNHMPLLSKRSDVEMFGVSTLGKDMLKKVKEMFGFEFATEDYHELLEQDLDGVVVSSPHYLHFEHTMAALEKGFHVLCEKPMTLRAVEAWDLVNTAKQKGVQILIPYGWNYKPFTREARKLMKGPGVGNIEYVLCHMASPTKTLFGGGVARFENWLPTLADPDPRTWQDPRKGGGYAHGQITHSSGLLFWLTELRATEVSARMTSPNSDVDMYDTASVVFESGAIGTFSGAATLPEGEPFQVDIRIFGDEGVLLLDVERERLDLRRHDRNHHHVDVPRGEGAYLCEEPPNRFVDIVLGKGNNDSPGNVGARTVELIEAMHQSADSGGRPTKVYR
jgi:predicted dehydrogenase